jgi:hypothetical protein
VGPGNCHLREWVVEASLDGQDWTIVDERVNNAELNNGNVSRCFDVREDLHRDCRFVRLRQTGQSHAKNDYMSFSSFEVFGDFCE